MAAEYNMRHIFRGRALIFEHTEFTMPGLARRPRSHVDCAKLKLVLERFKFDVNVHRDCTLSELRSHLTNVMHENHENHDCILIAILSHGIGDKIYSKDCHYDFQNLWNEFAISNSTALAGKPKIFIIQTCEQDESNVMGELTDSGRKTKLKLPAYADFLFVHFRLACNESCGETGSDAIKALCNYFHVYDGKLSILNLLTCVNRSITKDQPSAAKQALIMNSTLTRQLYFRINE